ncbi:hypothetical protein J2S43_001106 [Catenuloplanes nepalensis]|uniref:DUF3560 domain-containing protein n=1 Tax=Catenuloplanes nepalensis TaxID=587533 RepID=A0ABT9MMF5_9ACTN|nr:DUF3560 domain-containing protein [Catenuloplanes nepalensis]MDP9792594.1 hypothetical protein [Catenuloplanes nepalensis]
MITITHTHADGTILSGSVRGDGVWEIVTQYDFRYSGRVGIYIRGSRDHDAQQWRIDAAATALREHGFDVTVRIDNTPRPAAEREADRDARAAQRAERLNERAALAHGRRESRDAAARRLLDGIPTGQPLLTDHHSYAADRHRRERAQTHHDIARAEDRYAQHLTDRADAVRAHAAAAENPRVIMRRVEQLQARQRQWQRHLDTAGASAPTTWCDNARREIARLGEDIAHQKAKLDGLATAGDFVAWGPDTIATGDVINVSGTGWYRVNRVNRKSVSLDRDDWPKKAPYDTIFGRRRDGMQWDTPHGEPWPEADAIAVARWARHLRAAGAAGHDPAAQLHTTHVGYAQRIVHGLPITAGDPEVRAFTPGPDEPGTLTDHRRLAIAYLSVLHQLQAGDSVTDIAASISIDPRQPAWRMPTGEPVDRHPQDLHTGDIIAGVWDRGMSGRTLWRSFAGPVTAVSATEDRRDSGTWVTVTLADGTDRAFKTHQWLAVHCCPPR